MAHERTAILDGLKAELESLMSPAWPVFEQDETADELPCIQFGEVREQPNEEFTSRALRCMELSVPVTLRAATPAARDAACEALESAILRVDGASAFEFTTELVDMELDRDGAGKRTYPATYALTALHFTERT